MRRTWTLRSASHPNQPEITTTPRAVLLGALIVLVFGLAVPYDLEALEGRHDPWAGVLAIAVLIGVTLVHELGHVLAARSVGLWWAGLHYAGPAFQTRIADPPGHQRTNRDQLRVSVAGPVAGALAAGLVLASARAVGAGWLSGWCLGSLLALADSLVNMAPVGSADGTRILRAAAAIRNGRGHQPFPLSSAPEARL